jgi:acyl-coenzyme A thioesterase PaaI-like protein
VTPFERWRETLALRLWAWRNIRMIAWVRPRVVEMSADRCVIAVPLSRRTRNHLSSMYFGALCTGADAAAALLGFRLLRGRGSRISVVFQDVRGEFLRRPEADVHFACEQGAEIRELLDRAERSGERESLLVSVTATVPSISQAEPVARFALTLSVRKKG